MNKALKFGVPSFLLLGMIFLLIGFVQQGFRLTFESGMFNLGLIFTLSGLVVVALDKVLKKQVKEDEGPLAEAFKDEQEEE